MPIRGCWHACRDEDHLALFMELLGRMPGKVALTGSYARDFFTRHAELRHIQKLRYWPLQAVLQEKYHLPHPQVRTWASLGIASDDRLVLTAGYGWSLQCSDSCRPLVRCRLTANA